MILIILSVTREYEAALSNYDILITPTVSRTAPPNGLRDATPFEKSQSEAGIAVNTSQFNLTGHPAMSLPIGFLPDSTSTAKTVWLPVGMQIIGPLHGEEKILKVGYAYEKMFDWRKERED
jgi:amidase